MGPPGSGKDTQVEKLKGFLDLELVSTGDITRRLAEKNKEAEAIMDRGELLPDSLILAELKNEISAVKEDSGFVLDGFPRTFEQTGELEEILQETKREIDAVIVLNVPEEKLLERISARSVCSVCAEPAMQGEKKCAKCGGQTIKRDDDTVEVAKNRIKTYLEKTLPVARYYEKKGILLNIDGDQSVEDVAKEISINLQNELDKR